MDEANLKAAVKVLTSDKLHPILAEVARNYDLTEAEIRDRFAVYNNWPELRLEENPADAE